MTRDQSEAQIKISIHRRVYDALEKWKADGVLDNFSQVDIYCGDGEWIVKIAPKLE